MNILLSSRHDQLVPDEEDRDESVPCDHARRQSHLWLEGSLPLSPDCSSYSRSGKRLPTSGFHGYGPFIRLTPAGTASPFRGPGRFLTLNLNDEPAAGAAEVRHLEVLDR